MCAAIWEIQSSLKRYFPKNKLLYPLYIRIKQYILFVQCIEPGALRNMISTCNIIFYTRFTSKIQIIKKIVINIAWTSIQYDYCSMGSWAQFIFYLNLQIRLHSAVYCCTIRDLRFSIACVLWHNIYRFPVCFYITPLANIPAIIAFL